MVTGTDRVDAATTRDGRVVDFGSKVTVLAFTRPWVGHAVETRPRYYPGTRRRTAISLQSVPDDAGPDAWPGTAQPDSDGPFPVRECFLRWRRLKADTPVRAVVLRLVTRTEGRLHAQSGIQRDRTVRLVEVALAHPHQPRTALACAADLRSGWRGAAA